MKRSCGIVEDKSFFIVKTITDDKLIAIFVNEGVHKWELRYVL